MRLVCPNCAAQYEVAANAIPENGRDVQCASCGKTWFQDRLEAEAPVAVETSHDDTPDTDDTGGEDVAVTSPARPPKPSVDPSVLDILRREAEREAHARTEDEAAQQEETDSDHDASADAADAPEADEPVEDTRSLAERAREARAQLNASRGGDRRLNFSASDADADEVEDEDEDQDQDQDAEPVEDEEDQPPEIYVEPDLIEDLANDPAAPEVPDSVAPAPRRPARTPRPPRELPDVDELNSTLRSASDKDRAAEEHIYADSGPAKSVSGRLGFYLSVLIILILAAIYALAPQISQAVPGVAGILEQYVSSIDVLRRLLDSGVNGLIEAVLGLLAKFL